MTCAARIFLAVALLATFSGCGSFPPASFPGAAQTPASERAAAAATQRGDHVQAATMYESLAQRAPAASQANLQLLAAQEWLSASRAGDAGRVLRAITATLTPAQATQRRILEADTKLANGQTQQAWSDIAGITEPTTEPLASSYLDARMRIAMAAARPVDSVRAEISAERLAADPAGRSQWRRKLLTLLRQARDRGVKLEPAATQDGIVRGWLDLGAIANATRGVSLTGGGEGSRWRTRYPGHPATELLNEALPSALGGSTIARIGLLLPISTLAPARTIRDGLQYALTQLPAANRPQLKIYDTSTMPVGEALNAARADGSDFVIGPLTRDEIAAAADAATSATPVLALNFLPAERRAPAGFYQFALSPEDEARAVARRILASGLRRGTAIAPSGDWGNRVLAAFTQELRAGGGVLVTQASYDPNAHDYGVPIKQALGTNDSEARLRRVQNIVGGNLEFEPRRRADLDFVFAAGQSLNARLLRPQLRFQYAGSIPIFTTSDAYAPEAADANQDLNGIQFPDMPWLLPDTSLDELRRNLEQASPTASWRSRYFAFGYDAVQLAVAIGGAGRDSQRVVVSGLTGQLSIDGEGRVRRELPWAQITDGQPRLLGAAGTPN